jgi:Na+-translocating ferredoxin:NAD+ oxidoreductase subunit E
MASSDGEKTFQDAFWQPLVGGENPILVLMLGLCPTMAVTTSLKNGFFMGLGTIFVLFTSNLVVSLLRHYIPKDVRIPCFITVIATSVTIVDMTMAAAIPDVHEEMGIFIKLIVVNCIILGRAEGFASKNTVSASVGEGVGMGIGFGLTLSILGGLREVFGSGSLWDIPITELANTFMFGDVLRGVSAFIGFENSLMFVLPPGGFLILGLMMAATRLRDNTKGEVE